MASSIGSGIGNVGGHGEYKRNIPVQREADHNPQVGNDGFISSGGSLPAQEQVSQARVESQPVAEKTTAQPAAAANGNRNPITLSFDDGVSAIGLSSGVETVGLGAFTNGLGKNNITTISGKVLAGNPYGN